MNAQIKSTPALVIAHNKAFSLLNADFQRDKFAYYKYLREHLPVHQFKIGPMKIVGLARYVDCLENTKDPRFGRDRSAIVGGRMSPIPFLPKSLTMMMDSMIISDDPKHRRLRGLVQKAFSPKSLKHIEGRVAQRAQELIEQAIKDANGGVIDLQQAYALPLPTTIIGEMVGVSQENTDRLAASIRVLSQGMSGWGIVRTLAWDLGQAVKFIRELIDEKRKSPGDDILSGLISAEEEGDKLTEDEIVSTIFLLIIAGYETTVHLICNGTLALLQHPDELQRLRQQPELMGSAVEEILRFAGPIHGTKMNYAREDIELRGVKIKQGSAVMPLLGSANRDETIFVDADKFNITRDPNKHLSFSQGSHFCLGAFLARMEAKIAFSTLLENAPNLELGVAPETLVVQKLPGWHRYQTMPVRF